MNRRSLKIHLPATLALTLVGAIHASAAWAQQGGGGGQATSSASGAGGAGGDGGSGSTASEPHLCGSLAARPVNGVTLGTGCC